MKNSSKHVSRRRFLGLTSLMTLTTLSPGRQALAGSATRPFKIQVTSESGNGAAASQLLDLLNGLTRGILLERRYPEATYRLVSDRTLWIHVHEPESRNTLERLIAPDLSFGREEVHHLYAEALRSAVTLAPEEPYLVRALGDYYLSFRRYKEGIADFREIITDRPNQPLLLFQLGMIYDRSDNKQAAYDTFRLVHQQDRDNAVTLYNLGTIAADLGHYDHAKEWFSGALKQAPQMHDAKVQLKLLQRRKNRKPFTLEESTETDGP